LTVGWWLRDHFAFPEQIGDVTVEELLPGTTYHYAVLAHEPRGYDDGSRHDVHDGARDTARGRHRWREQPHAVRRDDQRHRRYSEALRELRRGNRAGSNFEPATGLQIVSAQAGQTAVTVGVSGLEPDTTYGYRVLASNVDGTTHGATGTFTTPPATSSAVITPAEPSQVATPRPRSQAPSRGRRVRRRRRRPRRSRAPSGSRLRCAVAPTSRSPSAKPASSKLTDPSAARPKPVQKEPRRDRT
jgi:hypothetical protein